MRTWWVLPWPRSHGQVEETVQGAIEDAGHPAGPSGQVGSVCVRHPAKSLPPDRAIGIVCTEQVIPQLGLVQACGGAVRGQDVVERGRILKAPLQTVDGSALLLRPGIIHDRFEVFRAVGLGASYGRF